MQRKMSGPSHNAAMPAPSVLASVQELPGGIVVGQLEGIGACDLAREVFVAHVMSLPEFHEHASVRGLAPGMLDVWLTHLNDMPVPQKMCLADYETPLTAARAVAGEGLPINSIRVRIEPVPPATITVFAKRADTATSFDPYKRDIGERFEFFRKEFAEGHGWEGASTELRELTDAEAVAVDYKALPGGNARIGRLMRFGEKWTKDTKVLAYLAYGEPLRVTVPPPASGGSTAVLENSVAASGKQAAPAYEAEIASLEGTDPEFAEDLRNIQALMPPEKAAASIGRCLKQARATAFNSWERCNFTVEEPAAPEGGAGKVAPHYEALIASFERTDPKFAAHLRRLLPIVPWEVDHLVPEVRERAFLAWARCQVTVADLVVEPTSTSSASAPQDCRVDVAPLSSLMAELYAQFEGNPERSAAVAASLASAWASLRDPSDHSRRAALPPVDDTREDTGSRVAAGPIPRLMQDIAFLVRAATNLSDGPSSLPGPEDHVEQPADRSFAAHYEAKARPSNVCFVLERLSDDDDDDDGRRGEGPRMAKGLSTVCQRLAHILRGAIEADERKMASRYEPPKARTAFGAATDGFRIVFMRMDVNTGNDRFQRPLIASRSRVLRLAPQSPPPYRKIGSGDELEMGSSGISLLFAASASGGLEMYVETPNANSDAEVALEVDESEQLPAWAMPPTTGSSSSSAVTEHPHLGLFGLVLALSNMERLFGCLQLSLDAGVLPPPLSADDASYWVMDPWEACYHGAYSCEYIVTDTSGEELVWKTVEKEASLKWLAQERDVLVRLAGCPNIIQCAAVAELSVDEADSTVSLGQVKVTRLGPAGSSRSSSEGGSSGHPLALVLKPVGIVHSRLTAASEEVILAGGIRGLLADMASALLAAHGKGVCHCDVQPAHIIVADKGFVLTDWASAADTGTKRLWSYGNALSHDELLRAIAKDTSEREACEVQPRLDCASLAYTVIALLYGKNGACPWVRWNMTADQILQARNDWLAGWRRGEKPDAEGVAEDDKAKLLGWVDMLLSDKPDLRALAGLRQHDGPPREAAISGFKRGRDGDELAHRP